MVILVLGYPKTSLDHPKTSLDHPVLPCTTLSYPAPAVPPCTTLPYYTLPYTTLPCTAHDGLTRLVCTRPGVSEVPFWPSYHPEAWSF